MHNFIIKKNCCNIFSFDTPPKLKQEFTNFKLNHLNKLLILNSTNLSI